MARFAETSGRQINYNYPQAWRYRDGVIAALESIGPDGLADLNRQLAEIKDRFDSDAKGGKATTGAEFNLLGTLTSRAASCREDGRPKLFSMGVRERSAPIDSPLYGRGEIDKPGGTVPRGVVQVVKRNSPAIPSSARGRRELANWLASLGNSRHCHGVAGVVRFCRSEPRRRTAGRHDRSRTKLVLAEQSVRVDRGRSGRNSFAS